ncbi:MAG: methyl-accepting chemotaxis protein [Myxococcota bacterium]|nr:methyl-accepting chemotaxis protein [Myxococcota bacterium]
MSSDDGGEAAGDRGRPFTSLSRRFSTILLALLIPVALVAASVRHGLLFNAEELIDALAIAGLADRSRSLILVQDDVTKELFLDPSAIELAARKIDAYDENRDVLRTLQGLTRSTELAPVVDEMVALEQRIRPLDTEILETLLASRVERARGLYFGEYREIRDDFENLSVTLATSAERQADRAKGTMVARNRATVFQTAGALLAGIGVVAVLVLRLSREVAGRTTSVLAGIERVGQGDLRPQPHDRSADEIGRIAGAFSDAVQRMRETVRHVAESLERVSDETRAIHELASSVSESSKSQISGVDSALASMGAVTEGAEGLASRADVLATAASESSDSLERLRAGSEDLYSSGAALGATVDKVSLAVGQLVAGMDAVMELTDELARASVETASLMQAFRTIDENAAETARRSADVVRAVEEGSDRMDRTIDGMSEIRSATDEAGDAISSLRVRAREIDGIVNVITEVGDETSMLALNAAILAAGAGEYGNGFGVVAKQMDALASSVLAQSREVGERIAAVQHEADRVGEAIGRGLDRVQAGEEICREASEGLTAIRAAAHESGERMKQVVEAVRHETRSVEALVDISTTIDDAVARTREALGRQREGAGSLSDAARSTTEIAEQLRGHAASQVEATQSLTDDVEKVRSSAREIRESVHKQTESCALARQALEGVAEDGRRSEASARDVRDRLTSLDGAAGSVREKASWFRF